MKTVIQVYKIGYTNVECNDRDNYHGIGDFLRSTLGMYRLSKIYNFRLFVDYSLHPIHKYIESHTHEHTRIVKETPIQLFCGKDAILEHVDSEDITVFFGWFGMEVYKVPITPEECTFMKSILVPTKSMQEYIDLKMREIPYKNFNIIHYRLGDDELVRSSLRNYTMTHITENIEPNTVLISDSARFKKTVSESNLDVFMFNDNVYHLGYSKDDDIKHTVFEFFLLKNAYHIKSYTVYHWESGFVNAASIIYQKSLEAGQLIF